MEPQRRRSTDHEGSTEVRLSLVEHAVQAHLGDCETRQSEIRKMFEVLTTDIKAISGRITTMQFGWMATAISLLGSGFIFLFGKVMKWW